MTIDTAVAPTAPGARVMYFFMWHLHVMNPSAGLWTPRLPWEAANWSVSWQTLDKLGELAQYVDVGRYGEAAEETLRSPLRPRIWSRLRFRAPRGGRPPKRS